MVRTEKSLRASWLETLAAFALVLLLDAAWWWFFVDSDVGGVGTLVAFAATATVITVWGWARAGTWKRGIWILLASLAATGIAFFLLMALFLFSFSF